MNVYLDYDSTLVDFNTAWVEFIRKYINPNFQLHNIEVYDQKIHENKALHDVAKQFWKIKEEYETVKLFEGARDFVEILLCEGCNVSIITSTSEGTHGFKTEHILNNFKGILTQHDIIHVDNTCLKWQYTKNGVLIDDFILPVLNHVFSNRMPGVVFNYNNMHMHADVTLNHKLFAETVYKIDSENLHYSTSYAQLLEMIKDFKENGFGRI
jgi:hypothetical protein